jgi:hypothetical protein
MAAAPQLNKKPNYPSIGLSRLRTRLSYRDSGAGCGLRVAGCGLRSREERGGEERRTRPCSGGVRIGPAVHSDLEIDRGRHWEKRRIRNQYEYMAL